VLLDVAAASVNYPDALLVRGEYQITGSAAVRPGERLRGDGARRRRRRPRLGPGRSRLRDRVRGRVRRAAGRSGGILRRVPEALGFDVAAAFPVVYATAYDALRSTAGVRPGETVLVLGAAGGVGLAAVEVATVLGARVIAAASSPEKCAAAMSRGAAATVDYMAQELKPAVKALAPGGVDVVIDPVGGEYSEAALRTMAPGGRFVVVGFASREIPRIPLNLVLLKGVEIRDTMPRSSGRSASRRRGAIARSWRRCSRPVGCGRS